MKEICILYVFSKLLPDSLLTNAPKIAYARLPNTQNTWLSTGVYVGTLGDYAQQHSSVKSYWWYFKRNYNKWLGCFLDYICAYSDTFLPLIIEECADSVT